MHNKEAKLLIKQSNHNKGNITSSYIINIKCPKCVDASYDTTVGTAIKMENNGNEDILPNKLVSQLKLRQSSWEVEVNRLMLLGVVALCYQAVRKHDTFTTVKLFTIY